MSHSGSSSLNGGSESKARGSVTREWRGSSPFGQWWFTAFAILSVLSTAFTFVPAFYGHFTVPRWIPVAVFGIAFVLACFRIHLRESRAHSAEVDAPQREIAALREVDVVYFNDCTLQDAHAVHIRSSLAKKIMTTRAWNRHVRDHSTSTEFHFGPAIAAVLFNDYWGFQPPKCYLYPKGIDRLDPFLPLLKEVAEDGQFFLPVITLLNLLEVAPRAVHLPVIVAAGKSWLTAHPDDKEFWIDQAIGRRLCSLLQAIFTKDPTRFGPDQPLRKDIDGFLASLVRMGVAEAHRLEESLFSASETRAEPA